MVTFYAVESATKFYCLSEASLTTGTVFDLLTHYYNQSHLTKAQFDSKNMQIQLQVKREELVFVLHASQLI